SVDGLDAKGNGVHLVAAADDFRLLLNHRRELLEAHVRLLALLQMLALDLVVQPFHLFAIRARRHSYIRIGLARRYARRRRRWRSDRLDRTRKRGLTAAKVHRTFFTLAHFAAPQLAQLIEPADELIETEAARIVADFQLVQLVDVDLDEAALVRRRLLLDAGEELVVFVLQLPEVFFELIE